MTIRDIEQGSPDFPELLASIPDAPRLLHVAGEVPCSGGVAIVGSRRPTAYGLRMARLLASAAAKAGVPTVSGLARGIDTEVHRATLDCGGTTWAILGSGLGKIYPSENVGLAESIVSQGGSLISEFELDDGPLREHFPKRNRIISGLAWATIVVEGDMKSGSLITAKAAADQGRDVLAVPGPADSRLSEGPLSLIKAGAPMAMRWQDVLEASPVLAAQVKTMREEKGDDLAKEAAALDEEQGRVVELLGAGETPWEELFARAQLPVERLAEVLLELEMEGRIRSCPGQRYAKN